MFLIALALVLIAAMLHAVWNVLLKTSGNPLLVSARASATAVLLFSPLAAVAWLLSGRPGMSAEFWLLAVLSSIAELVYFVCLSAAYRRGELSVVYPLARGTAPLLAVTAGIVLLGERLGPPEAAGVLCLLAGIWAVRRPAAAGSATLPALFTGVMIATYSTIDRVGVTHVVPWLYAWVLGVFTALLLAGWVGMMSWFSREAIDSDSSAEEPPAEGTPAIATDWQRSMVVGVLFSVTYLLVLFALSIAPLAVIAPLRESAIVLVTIWGIWRLQERHGMWLRLGGAAVMVLGIVLLAL